MNPIFLGKIKNGKVVVNNIFLFDDYLRRLEGKDVEVVVKKWQKTRSNQQNRYLWGVVYELISETTGYTPDEVHDAMRMLFLRDTSRKIPTLRSTTILTTVEFEAYLESIRQWAAQELGCVIPLPNEVEF